MTVVVRSYRLEDVPAMRLIWNNVVEDGRAFPQVEALSEEGAAVFFAEQTRSAVAVDEATGKVLGLYILHPNDIGRKVHVANASYAVAADARNKGVGRALVADSLAQVAPCGFRGMQFNAVVVSNAAAVHLYESLGMRRIGTIPGGFLNAAGEYENMHIYYYEAV